GKNHRKRRLLRGGGGLGQGGGGHVRNSDRASIIPPARAAESDVTPNRPPIRHRQPGFPMRSLLRHPQSLRHPRARPADAQSGLLSRLRGRGTTRQRGGGGCPTHWRKRPPPSVACGATFPRRREKDPTASLV